MGADGAQLWGKCYRLIRYSGSSVNRQHVTDFRFCPDAQNYWNWRIIFMCLSEWLEEQRFKTESINSSFGRMLAIKKLSLAVDKIYSGHDPSYTYSGLGSGQLRPVCVLDCSSTERKPFSIVSYGRRRSTMMVCFSSEGNVEIKSVKEQSHHWMFGGLLDAKPVHRELCSSEDTAVVSR